MVATVTSYLLLLHRYIHFCPPRRRCSSKWHLGHLAHYIAHCTLHSGDLQTRCDQPSSSSNLTCHTEHYLLLLVVLCSTYSLRKQTFHHSAVHAPPRKESLHLYGLNGLYEVLAFITSWPHRHPLFRVPYYQIPTSDLRCTEASFETSITTHIPRPRPGHPSRPTHSLISARERAVFSRAKPIPFAPYAPYRSISPQYLTSHKHKHTNHTLRALH